MATMTQPQLDALIDVFGYRAEPGPLDNTVSIYINDAFLYWVTVL